ncbi:MAG: hypothetical protein ACM3X1_06230 [Ignavibacteriales bacterium]
MQTELNATCNSTTTATLLCYREEPKTYGDAKALLDVLHDWYFDTGDGDKDRELRDGEHDEIVDAVFYVMALKTMLSMPLA